MSLSLENKLSSLASERIKYFEQNYENCLARAKELSKEIKEINELSLPSMRKQLINCKFESELSVRKNSIVSEKNEEFILNENSTLSVFSEVLGISIEAGSSDDDAQTEFLFVIKDVEGCDGIQPLRFSLEFSDGRYDLSNVSPSLPGTSSFVNALNDNKMRNENSLKDFIVKLRQTYKEFYGMNH